MINALVEVLKKHYERQFCFKIDKATETADRLQYAIPRLTKTFVQASLY